MSTPLDDMQARYDSEYKEQLEYAEARNWQWFLKEWIAKLILDTK